MTRRRSFVLVALVAAALAGGAAVRRAEAAQTVQATINNYTHSITIPDGWLASPQQGGIILRPPSGRAPSVQVFFMGVPRGRDVLDARALAQQLADDERKKKPYLEATPIDPRRWMGLDGALVTLEGVPPNGAAREAVVLVTAVTSDTLYLFDVEGKSDEVMSVVKEIVGILESITPGQRAQAGRGAPPPPDRPAWANDPPLKPPANKRAGFVDDPLIGVKIDTLPGWGVAASSYEYVLEKRIDDKRRVIVAVYLGDTPFEGRGDKYVQQVVGKHKYEWKRYLDHDALFIERPAEVQGAGDAFEIHVVRRGRPLVIYFRADGLSLDSPEARRARIELEAATIVLDATVPSDTIALGGVAQIGSSKRWKLKSWGPGSSASYVHDSGVTVWVFVYTTTYWKQNLTCDHDGKPPAETSAKLLRRNARVFTCASDGRDQLLYVIPSGEHSVFMLFSDEKQRKPHAAAAEFLKLVKLR